MRNRRRPIAVKAGVIMSVAVLSFTTAACSDAATSESSNSPGANQDSVASQSEGDWTSTWYAAMTQEDDENEATFGGFTDTTIRQSVHVSVGGDNLRLRLSNAYGEQPLEIGAVTVSTGDASSEFDGEPTPVTFDGSDTTTIPVGAEWISDPVDMDVEPNSDLVVSIYLPGPTGPATTHPLGMSTSLSAEGNQTTASTDAYEDLDESRYFLTGVDVTSEAPSTTVFFGDSITDGHSSTVDANLRYPDQVADEILERPVDQQCSVLNAGISGNRMLTDADSNGVSAMSRFDTDVLARPGVDTVVLLEGINDIGTSEGEVTAEELIASYQQFINRAKSHDLTVIGATLTPFTDADYYTDEGEQTRQEVNDWIRTSGAFDDVIDFDDTVRDPDSPERINPEFDPGDHLHPNDQGYTAMAETVDIDVICQP